MRTPEAFEHQPEADSFRFDGAASTLLRAVRAHRWVVVATAVLTTLLVALYIWIWPPIFQAEVILAADSEQDIQRTAFYQGWNVFRREGLTDEATLMASPPVLREVVETLDLKYDDVYHPFMNYAVHLWAKSWVGRNYRKAKLWILGETDQPANGMTPEQLEFFRVLSDFEQGVSVTQVGEANIGLLVVRGPNQRVAEIANKIAEVYLRQRRERYVAEAKGALDSLSVEAAKTQAELEALDLEIRAFRAESGAVLVFEQDRGLIGQWLVMRSAVIDLEAAEADAVSALRALQRQVDQEGAQLRSDRVFRQDAEKDRLPRLQQQLLQARQSFQPDSREVREIEEQIRQAMRSVEDGQPGVIVRNSLSVSQTYEALLAKKMALESALAGTRAALQIKRGELTQLRSLLDQIPEKMQRNRELERRQTTLENKYAGIAEKLTVATVSMASAKSAPSALRVVEAAHPPDKPAWPQTKLMIVAALIGGGIVGVIVALLLDVVFERVNRNRLSKNDPGLRPFALVDQDEKFLRTLFPRERAL
jgi:uncharacterized protein involved in exopolysaccharide biosynthesis